MKKRSAEVKRKTRETDVKLALNIDGKGHSKVDTQIPFFDHMLTLLATHSLFDLRVIARGDIKVDYHHTVEDVGLSLGEAFQKAIGDKRSIKRYSSVALPMDESLVSMGIDISGRPLLVFNVPLKKAKRQVFDADLTEEFLQAFVSNARVTLHVNLIYGRNTHHIIEAVFKNFAKVLREASAIDKNRKGVPSSKGKL